VALTCSSTLLLDCSGGFDLLRDDRPARRAGLITADYLRGTLARVCPGAWYFPVGTRFWKEFTFAGRKVETRFLWKASRAGWVAASYVWNADGTEATLAPERGVAGVAEIAPGRHSIPSRTDCAACHGAPQVIPLGFNPLQLSTDRDPNAIHGEPLAPGMVTLRTLADEKLLVPAPRGHGETAPRIATARPQTRAVLGYLAANCGGCHNGNGDISVSQPSLRYKELLRDGDAVMRALVGQPSKWQVPGRPEGSTALIDPASPEWSAILVRMRSRRPSTQMPPLATVIRDEKAVDAIARWIEADLGQRD
jgi:cytochrome c553